MSSSPHTDNKKKYILILGKGPAQGLEHTLAAEKLFSVSSFENNKKFRLSLLYNGPNSYLFEELLNLKQKILKLYHITCVWETFEKSFL